VLLIVTSRADYTADWLILELEKRGARYVRFNTEDFPASVGLRWRGDGGGELRFGSRVVDLESVGAAWYRRPALPVVDASDANAIWAAGEAREALDGVWRTLDALWVNRPDRNRQAESKPEQLRRAAGMGFTVPVSVITNDPTAAHEFAAEHADGVVCKPLRTGRIGEPGPDSKLFFTTLLDADAIAALDGLGPEPYLFQAFVSKRYDVRVTVIGRDAFAARIDSQADAEARVDWRHGDPRRLAHHIEELPAEVALQCVELVASYGLHFGAIDLAATDDGYAFFEINPNGQWAWLEQVADLPLRARLADLLTT
jgi:hypothetical protein